MKMTNSFGKMVLAVGCAAAMAGSASADTWYLKKSSDGVKGQALSDLSYWTNSVGTVGSGTPTIDDYLVIPVGGGMRSSGASSSFVMTAKRLTVNGTFTHDWGGDPNWVNDGLFLGSGSEYYFNWCYRNYSFSSIGTTTMKGTVTINGTSSKPTIMMFDQLQYSNVVYAVNKLVGAAGSAVELRPQWVSGIRNNTLRVVDASEYKGDFTCAYVNDSSAKNFPPLDNGQYGGRTVFRNLDTPGTLTLGKNWTLGAEAGCVTRAANVVLGDGVRLEVAASASSCSRLEATTALTVGSDVQIYLIGSLGSHEPGRHPILTAPCEIDTSKFVLKKLPVLADVVASLDADYVGGKGTLYLTIGTERYVDAVNGNNDWDGTVDKPKKTLAAAMAIAKPYDTVYAAEGTYNEGEMYSNCATSNRVVVPPYVTLEASGDRDKTIIEGKISTVKGNSNGCWSNAVRCVCLNKGSVVKGFTLKNGRTCNCYSTDSEGPNNCGGAVYGADRGLLVDSVITGCGSANRGPNVYSAATLLRCQVQKWDCGSYDFYMGSKAIDSLICGSSQRAYRSCEFVNCTFPYYYMVHGNGTGEKAILRNCLHRYVASGSVLGRYSYVYNSYFCSSWTTNEGATKDDYSRFNVPAAEVSWNSSNFRPKLSSAVIGNGDLTMYLATTNDWPWTMRRQFTMKDMYGTDRLEGGALDIGAIQHCNSGSMLLVK